jgi:hypothetical protein
MKEALLLTNQILEHEPKNKMVLEYKTYLRQYIQQGTCASFMRLLIDAEVTVLPLNRFGSAPGRGRCGERR